MKRILVINGHPAKEGFSSFLVSSYIFGAKNKETEIKTLSLSNLSFDSAYKKYPSLVLEADLIKAQKLIAWANHIVFIYPTWWGSMPAILKGFIDRSFVSGFAYKYTSDGKRNKLLKGKTARIITTIGANFMYTFANHILLTGTLKYPVLKYCGFGSVKTTVFSKIRRNLSLKRTDNIKKKCISLGIKDSKY